MTWFDLLKGKRYKKGNLSRKGNLRRKQKKANICPTPNKKKYENHGHALKNARQIMKRTGNRTLKVYRCGDHYHLGKQGL